MPPAPWMLDSAEHQIWIKDFFWRVTEELTEAIEYLEKGSDYKDPLFIEEMSDALHFLVEPLVMLGVEPNDAVFNFAGDADSVSFMEAPIAIKFVTKSEREAFHIALMRVIFHLGVSANCLKNKKWKKTHTRTDTMKFYFHYREAWRIFIYTLRMLCKYSHQDIYELYHKKAIVNKFRQDTNY